MNQRYFVPDLTPEAHPEVRAFKPRVAFVAESPHVSEVSPDSMGERRPLCGKAGAEWWSMLEKLLGPGVSREGKWSTLAEADYSAEALLEFCRKHRIAVLNAVQFPLDPKIATRFKDAEPGLTVGFSKEARADHYKKMKATAPVRSALERLRARLEHPSLAETPVHALGNDSEWFVTQAVAPNRVGTKIPHPSAWWRRGGAFREMARERLGEIFESEISRSKDRTVCLGHGKDPIP
jgi:hypothetical protein